MSKHHTRRAGALLAAGAVTVAVLSPTSASAAGGPTTGPAAGAASWIAGELDGGLLPGTFTYGQTIDVGLSLHAVGSPPDVVQPIVDAIEENLESYISGEDFGDIGSTYANAASKALTFAHTVGANARDFGGTDLVSRVEGITAPSGRISDQSTYPGDYANVLGQAFAVRGLSATGSPEAPAATDFLLGQQCSEGFFRLELGASDGACDADPDAAGDTDVTAFVLLALAEQAGDPGVDAAIDATVGWLEDAQGADGGFGGGVGTEARNTNSTGLAGWALAEAGAEEAAADAAAWVAALQAPADNACTTGPLTAEAGALAYDQEAYDLGEAEGISEDRAVQWRYATAQALPVLQHLEGVAAVNALRLVGPRGFQRARSSVDLTVRGLGAVGDGCVTGPGAKAAVTGAAPSASVKLPGGTGERTYTASWLGDPATTTVKVLGATRLDVDAKRGKVKAGRKQVVKVAGLVQGERVKVLLRGRKVDAGRASRSGRFTARFVVRGKPGRAKVKAVGHFGNRRGTDAFRVVR